MLNMSSSAIPKGRGFRVENLNQVSSWSSAIPTTDLFGGRRIAISSNGLDGKCSRNISLSVRSQYLTPDEQKYRQHSSNFPSLPGEFSSLFYCACVLESFEGFLWFDSFPNLIGFVTV